MPQRPNTMEDFWRNVDVRGEDDCWEWKRSLNRDGYGRFKFGGRSNMAHRLALSTVAEIPAGSVVCHSCDNPACCNPKHLVIGTHADNVRDKVRKGRQAKGASMGRSKLVECEVHFIKHSEIKQTDLAEIFGVSQTLISAIKTCRSWGHVA